MKKCSVCRIEYPDIDNFCMECGRKLDISTSKIPFSKEIKKDEDDIKSLQKKTDTLQTKLDSVMKDLKSLEIVKPRDDGTLPLKIQELESKIKELSRTPRPITREVQLKATVNKELTEKVNYLENKLKNLEKTPPKVGSVTPKMDEDKIITLAKRLTSLEKDLKSVKEEQEFEEKAPVPGNMKNKLENIDFKIKIIQKKIADLPTLLTSHQKNANTSITRLEKEMTGIKNKISFLDLDKIKYIGKKISILDSEIKRIEKNPSLFTNVLDRLKSIENELSTEADKIEKIKASVNSSTILDYELKKLETTDKNKHKELTKKITNLRNELRKIESQSPEANLLLRVGNLENELITERNRIEKLITDVNSGAIVDYKMKQIEETVKKAQSGIRHILNYMKDNEKTIEDIENKITNVVKNDDLKTLQEKIKFDTEKLLALHKEINTLKPTIRALKIRKSLPESSEPKALQKKIQTQADDITSLSKTLNRISTDFSNNINSNKKELDKLSKKIDYFKLNVIDVNKKEMEKILINLINDEKVLIGRIRAIIKQDKETIVKAMNEAIDIEKKRFEEFRQATETTINSDLDKFNQMRKDLKLTLSNEVKKLEGLYKDLNSAGKREMQKIKKAAEMVESDINNAEKKVKNIESIISTEVARATKAVDSIAAKEVARRLRDFENARKENEERMNLTKELISHVEKRLATEIINLTHKVNTLSNIQKTQELQILGPEKPIRKMFDELLVKEKDNLIKSIRKNIANNILKKDEFSNRERYLIDQINALKSKVSNIQSSNREIIQGIKKEIIKETLNDIEKAMV